MGMNGENELENSIRKIIGDESFTYDFKDFSIQATLIVKLCRMYEEGTGIAINLNDKKCRILDFIKSVKPVLKEMGVSIHLSKKLMISVIRDFYVPIIKEL